MSMGTSMSPTWSPRSSAATAKAQMQRIDALMEQKLKTFLDGVPTDGLAVTPVLKLGEPRR